MTYRQKRLFHFLPDMSSGRESDLFLTPNPVYWVGLVHFFLIIMRFVIMFIYYLSLVMRKPDFCICENKDADQLCGNREADQRLCFRYTDSSILLLHKSEISSLWSSSVAVQVGLCRTWSETPKTGFLRTRLIYLITSWLPNWLFS